MTSRANNLPATLLSALPDGRLSHSVFKTMSETEAQLERFAWLGDELALAVWRRDTPVAETSYNQPGHHTLSFYLDGGHRTERWELPGLYGAPKRLCTLPDWHESSWTVRGQMHFMHLYFLPEHFTRRAVVELDREPRELTLADRTYFEHERIAQLCATLASMSWEGADAQLRANEITHETLSHLLLAQSVPQHQQRVRGGLAPVVRRRLADYIEAHLAQSITVGMLAELACLSEYHLVRMFKTSFGMTPSAWIAARRIDRARTLLKSSGQPLQQIADACGYADLSHFSHRFRDATSASPSRYRAVVTA
ncbi:MULTISPECIES: helix-turn-helix domain-containing protein [unclassified Duganella]|uniref:helix-turn-helix domain-containing protein n=1 Tax=unclassified Duganella TaxID=2636909 RepID=UPI0008858E3A|nr:AraC family transcriptional regulator [Duganella sp. OV458]SDJ30245.1 AraC family transcriptional regulator [Duganella sp. OV510]